LAASRGKAAFSSRRSSASVRLSPSSSSPIQPASTGRAWGGAVNLEPFYTIRRFLIHYRRTGSLSSLFNLLGNVVILIPLGVLLPVLLRPMRRVWLAVPLLAAVCAGVEWLQWRTGLGVADVDDSILNFVGALAGWAATRLCQLAYFHFKGAKQ